MRKDSLDPKFLVRLTLAGVMGLALGCEKRDEASTNPEDAAKPAAADGGSDVVPETAETDAEDPSADPLADIADADEKPPEFTKDEQVEKGMAVYDAKCAGCHGGDGLGKKKTPAVMGSDAFTHGKYTDAAGLRSYIYANMPPKKDNRLDEAEADAVTAFILNANAVELPGPLWSGNRDKVKFDLSTAE